MSSFKVATLNTSSPETFGGVATAVGCGRVDGAAWATVGDDGGAGDDVAGGTGAAGTGSTDGNDGSADGGSGNGGTGCAVTVAAGVTGV
ncbi:MAG: hypothetical protein ACE5LL_07165, partial [Alphaproteobacteria bacterium]